MWKPFYYLRMVQKNDQELETDITDLREITSSSMQLSFSEPRRTIRRPVSSYFETPRRLYILYGVRDEREKVVVIYCSFIRVFNKHWYLIDLTTTIQRVRTSVVHDCIVRESVATYVEV